MAGEEEQLKALLWSLVEADLGQWPEDKEEVLDVAEGLRRWLEEKGVSARIGVPALAVLLVISVEQTLAEEKEAVE